MPKKISEVRRPEIVDALYEALLEHGVTLPGYDKIAAKGDMSRQLVRHYFPDQEDMMLALCDAMDAVYRDCMVQSVIAADQIKRLGIFLDFYFDFLADKGMPKPKDDAVYDAMMAYANVSDKLKNKMRTGYGLVQSVIAHEIQVSYPSLPQSACHELGFLMVSLMYGHWKMVATLGFSVDHNRVSREAIERLIDSYVDGYDEPE